MAYAYLAVSPPSMTRQFEEVWQISSLTHKSLFHIIPQIHIILYQMAAAASNKTTSKKDMKYPEIEEQALQFVLDSCESSITKYSKFLQVSEFFIQLDKSVLW